MAYEWIESYLLSKKGAVKEFKVEWDAYRFMLGDKMFAMQGLDNQGREILTLKLEPEFGLQMRNTYEEVIPGYYMNKVHWNSVLLKGHVPEAVFKTMLDQSYELVLKGLSQKKQKELLG